MSGSRDVRVARPDGFRRIPLVVGNWKMDPASIADAVALARAVAGIPRDGVRVGVAPPAIALAAVAEALRGDPRAAGRPPGIRVYAQDLHWEERGAYTGQIAAAMLAGIAGGAIVGHSEVRRDQGDDDERVSRKLARALAARLEPILCVGESEREFDAGETEAVVARQVRLDLAATRREDVAPGDRPTPLAIAYEPIWAIGTGRPASGAHAAAAARVIRATLGSLGMDGDKVMILYGGSVSAAGVGEFAAADGIDGALVGGASLKVEEFAGIVRAFAR